jgi:hypothetical protein
MDIDLASRSTQCFPVPHSPSSFALPSKSISKIFKASACLLVLAVIYSLFWSSDLEGLPREYTEYGEVDLVSLSLAKAKNELEARTLYRESYTKNFFTKDIAAHPRVPFEEEIKQFPLEILFRTMVKKWFPPEEPLKQFKVVNVVVLAMAAAAYWLALSRFFSVPLATVVVALHITLLPIVTVGRVSGRLSCLLTSFLVPITLIAAGKALKSGQRSKYALAGGLLGLCFFNGLHSNILILPALALLTACWWLNEKKKKARPGWDTAMQLTSFLGSALITNIFLAFAAVSLLNLDFRTFVPGFLLISSYSLRSAGGQIGVDGTNVLSFTERFIWLLQSFFTEAYWYPSNNHVEEYVVGKPLLGEVWVILGIGGLLTSAMVLRKQPVLVYLSASLLVLLLGMVLFSSQPMPPRYFMGILPVFPFLGAFVVTTVFHYLDALRLRVLGWIVCPVIVLSPMVWSYQQLFTGEYFETGGNTLVMTTTTWRGNAEAVGKIMKRHSNEDLQKTALVVDRYGNPSITQLISNHRFGRVYFAKAITATGGDLKEFIEKLPSDIQRIYFLCDHPIKLILDRERKSPSLNLHATAFPLDDLEMLIPNIRAAFISRLNHSPRVATSVYMVEFNSRKELGILDSQNLAAHCVTVPLDISYPGTSGIPQLKLRSTAGNLPVRYLALNFGPCEAESFLFRVNLDGSTVLHEMALTTSARPEFHLFDPFLYSPPEDAAVVVQNVKLLSASAIFPKKEKFCLDKFPLSSYPE